MSKTAEETETLSIGRPQQRMIQRLGADNSHSESTRGGVPLQAAVILGAGFSRNSGIPTQAQIPEQLVRYKEKNAMDTAVTNILRQYMKDIFGYEGGMDYPGLDDMFTCIDISTNSGHHLGMAYSPLHLRAIRRMLVYRVFSILDDMYTPSDEVEKLLKVMTQRYSHVDFVVLNWDMVLERYLRSLIPEMGIHYGNEGIPWQERSLEYVNRTGIFKIHGSSNWLYCDNCRTLFFDTEHEIPSINKAGFQELDFVLFPELKRGRHDIKAAYPCRMCRNPISSHIATFSYRKSFRANSFDSVWRGAEDTLVSADQWIFIGYSLPDADYEFKHLLKIAQLKLRHLHPKGPEIDVVLLNADKAVAKYRQFFGSCLGYVCNEGIHQYTEYLQNLL